MLDKAARFDDLDEVDLFVQLIAGFLDASDFSRLTQHSTTNKVWKRIDKALDNVVESQRFD